MSKATPDAPEQVPRTTPCVPLVAHQNKCLDQHIADLKASGKIKVDWPKDVICRSLLQSWWGLADYRQKHHDAVATCEPGCMCCSPWVRTWTDHFCFVLWRTNRCQCPMRVRHYMLVANANANAKSKCKCEFRCKCKGKCQCQCQCQCKMPMPPPMQNADATATATANTNTNTNANTNANANANAKCQCQCQCQCQCKMQMPVPMQIPNQIANTKPSLLLLFLPFWCR